MNEKQLSNTIVLHKKRKHFTDLFDSDLIKSTHLTGPSPVSLMWELR